MPELSNEQLQSRQIESTRELQLTQEMKDFVMQKLGLQEEDIREAIKDPAFAGDLQNLMNNPENPTEKHIFLGKYVFDGIIQEAKKQGKDPVDFAIEQGKTEDFASILDAYIAKINKRDIEKGIAGKKQVAEDIRSQEPNIDKEISSKLEERVRLNSNLKTYTEQVNSSLSEEGKKKISEGVSSLKQDDKFIKELESKGYKQEDIKSGKFDDTISAYYIARNANTFNVYVEDKEKFEKATRSIADLLKIDGPVSLSDISKIIPPGDRKDQILNTSTALLNSGKYTPELTTYNSSTGKITFRSKYSDDITQIDTSKVPPVLEYSRGGLSIGREVAPVTTEEKEYRETKEQSGKNSKLILTSEQEYAGIKSDLLSQQSIAYFQEQNKNDSSIASIFDQRTTLEKEYTEAKNASSKSEILGKLISLNSDLNTKRIQAMQIPNTGTDLMRDTFEGVLEKEGLTLKNLKKQVDIQVELDKKLAKGGDKKSEGNIDQAFEKDAKSTLGYLNYIGYTELGQGTLDMVIRAINARNQGNIQEINLSKNPKLDSDQQKELLRTLAQLSRKSSLMESWQGVNPSDEIIAVRQMNSPNWRTSLQDISKGIKFQSMKSGAIDAFTNYLYEKPETETQKVEKPTGTQS